MKKTLGGERLGSGKKIKVDLHGWGRSTFDQSRIWRSTMGVGPLTPCFVEIGTNGTTFDIDINTIGHTIPAIAPLFGSFKLQIDMFACPIRLYQGLLHNNAVNIGMEMAKVLLPNVKLKGNGNLKTCTSSLNNYCGIKGKTDEKDTFNAIPILAYYDIFKQYYSNKQEDNAYVINWDYNEQVQIRDIRITKNNTQEIDTKYSEEGDGLYIFDTSIILSEGDIFKGDIYFPADPNIDEIKLLSTDFSPQLPKAINFKNIKSKNGIITGPNQGYQQIVIGSWEWNNERTKINFEFIINPNLIQIQKLDKIYFTRFSTIQKLESFPLNNIDEARKKILAKTELNQRITINEDLNFQPYKTNVYPEPTDEMQGLVVKTYLSDIFNTWLSTEYVDLINDISSVDTENGTFSMDALILAKKVYQVLNRIAVSGGTYEDWQEANWGENAIQRAESPIYIGGTSAEIRFEEVVSTAGTEEQPLATLGGKGTMTDKKGGNIVYKCNEPCIIMGIASITPRIDYYQGNKWYVTDLDNMDNLHKPGLDGIGFQNIIANNVYWQGSTKEALAKQPAWIHYQTAVNEVFGHFAKEANDENNLQHMVLRRNYEIDNNGDIIDWTTYIDPSKFNYAFADNSVTAQNFWIQIGFNVKSRRKMGAYEIPNL